MLKKILPAAVLVLLLGGCATTLKAPMPNQASAALPPPPTQVIFTKDQVQAFAKQVATKNGLSEQAIMAILNQAVTQPQIINAMNKPYEKLSWARYQTLYVRPSLITGGVKFWNQNQKSLTDASKRFGVPPQIILSILGVETVYGQNIGTVHALDALYTLAFSYPRRAGFFQTELAAYLVLTQESGFDPLTLTSSYAGALGIPQFMPSTYLQYAVSNSKSYPNLFSNNADAIGSIANYLDQMGWQANAPIAVKARLNKNVKLTPQLTEETYTLEQFRSYGIHAEYKMPGELRANLITLQGKDGTEYWLVFRNFYMIKRYNSSNLYAMAVYQLSEKIQSQIKSAGS